MRVTLEIHNNYHVQSRDYEDTHLNIGNVALEHIILKRSEYILRAIIKGRAMPFI